MTSRTDRLNLSTLTASVSAGVAMFFTWSLFEGPTILRPYVDRVDHALEIVTLGVLVWLLALWSRWQQIRAENADAPGERARRKRADLVCIAAGGLLLVLAAGALSDPLLHLEFGGLRHVAAPLLASVASFGLFVCVKTTVDRYRANEISRRPVRELYARAWLKALGLPMIVVLALVLRGLGSVAVLYACALATMGVVAFVYYGYDKAVAVGRAKQGIGRHVSWWRIPEARLHALEFACGYAGAALAQRVLHHKISKQSFQVEYRLAVVAHLVLAAAYAWLAQPVAQAEPVLRAALTTLEDRAAGWTERRAAVARLRRLGSRAAEAERPLLLLALDEDWKVEAQRALHRVAPGWKERASAVLPVAAATAGVAAPTAEELAAWVPDWQERSEEALDVARLEPLEEIVWLDWFRNTVGSRPFVVARLAVLLDDSDGHVRSEAAERLGFESELPIPVLRRLEALFSDPDEPARVRALEALAHVGPTPQALGVLVDALGEGETILTLNATRALIHLGPEVAASAVPELLDELVGRVEARVPQHGIRGAAHSLGDALRVLAAGNDAAFERLAPALARGSAGPFARAGVCVALAGFRDRADEVASVLEEHIQWFEDDRHRMVPDQAVGTLLLMGEAGTRALRNRLGDELWTTRRQAAWGLGAAGAAASFALPDLQRLTEDEHPEVREAAEEALQAIRAPDAQPTWNVGLLRDLADRRR